MLTPLSTAPHVMPTILALGTALPQYSAAQRDIGEWMAASFDGQRSLQRLVRMVHNYSGIDRRYSCRNEYLLPPDESPFAPGQPLEKTITTAERMAIYEEEAPVLGTAAAEDLFATLASKRNVTTNALKQTITHVVAVSCTGFFAPGLDFAIAQQLGLPPTIKRSLIGFMGCSAAFNGLRAASDIVRGDPTARVLVVCVELCSLHATSGTNRDLLVAASLFSDGAAAALVGLPDVGDSDYFSLQDFYTGVKPGTQEEMVWRIGNHGFALHLSPRIPDHLAEVAPNALHELFNTQRPDFWAIHPGGRAIVDKLAQVFALTPEETHASYAALREHGNLSSGTILFILKQMQETMRATGETNTGIAMAFGPGLVIEMAKLTYVPEPLTPAPQQEPSDALPVVASPISSVTLA